MDASLDRQVGKWHDNKDSMSGCMQVALEAHDEAAAIAAAVKLRALDPYHPLAHHLQPAKPDPARALDWCHTLGQPLPKRQKLEHAGGSDTSSSSSSLGESGQAHGSVGLGRAAYACDMPGAVKVEGENAKQLLVALEELLKGCSTPPTATGAHAEGKLVIWLSARHSMSALTVARQHVCLDCSQALVDGITAGCMS